MIKTRQLAHARTLFRFGNFSRAAIASNLSQSAFSRSIRSLESELGVALFDRNGNDVIPTQFGEVLLQRAEQIVADTEELEREIGLMQGLEVGCFGVAMAQFPAELTGGRALAQMACEHPELRFNIIQSDWQNVRHHVLSRNVDLGFAEISVAEEDERFETELVGRHKLALFCRAEHPLANQEKVTREELNQYPLVAVSVAGRLLAFPGKSSIDEETGYLVPSIGSANLGVAREIVAGSNAFGPMTPLQIEKELMTGRYRILPFWEPWLHLNYGFISLRRRTMSPAARMFMTLVKQTEREVNLRNQRLFDTYLADFQA